MSNVSKVDFQWTENISEFDESFKKCNEESDKWYFLKFMLNILKKHDLNNNLPSLPEKMKTEEAGKLFVNLNGKFECVINIWNLKQALNLALVLIKLEWLNLVKNLG